MEVIYLNHMNRLHIMKNHVMAIGFFDGVHLGHQQLFTAAKRLAKTKGYDSSALTFSPHPDEVIKGDRNRKYLTLLHEKIEKIASCGLDKLYVMDFDKSFASLSPIDFIRQYIMEMKAKHIVVGFDFTFGFKAEGNTNLLKQTSIQHSFGLTIIPEKTFLNKKIGSTETKKIIYDGIVELVPHFLGAHYEIDGQIKYKRTNVFQLAVNEKYILPKQGKYIVTVVINKKTYDGELTMQPNNENELLLYDYENKNDQALKITFLNRLTVKNAV